MAASFVSSTVASPVSPPVSMSRAWPRIGFRLATRSVFILAAALLTLFAVMLLASVRQESPTFDEPVHLYSGFEYLKAGDFGHNPEHPPLAKMFAALPLLGMHLRQPSPPPVPYFKVVDGLGAVQLLYTADADRIIFRGRLMMACFSLVLGMLVFLSAREMFGDLAGLLALTLFVFEPVLLANGALVTTDMPLACTFFASVYSFYRFAKRPSVLRGLVLALCCVLTLAVKHSGILILPTLVLLAAADLLLRPQATVQPTSQPTSGLLHNRAALYAVTFLAVLVLCYVGLWAVYGFRFAARPGNLTIAPGLAAYGRDLSTLQRGLIGFCAQHHLLPEAYLFGWVDILLIPGYRPSFLMGHLYGSGQWFYLPVLFLFKTTVTVLVLLALVPLARVGRQHRREFLFLILPPAFFLLLGAASRVNMGVRHILPVYPFCLVLAGAAAGVFFMRSLPARMAVVAGVLCAAVSSLHAYPDYLAYANELVGGPAHAYHLAADANDDWGQTLKWTRAFLDRDAPNQPCWIDYTSPIVPLNYYGIHCRPLLTGMAHVIGVPVGPIPATISGTVLVTANDISGIFWGPAELNPYAPFRDRHPDAVIGNAVLVYHGTFTVPLLAAESNATVATALLRSGQPGAALPFARAAVAQQPNFADLQANVAEVLFATGQPAEAQQHLARAMQLAHTEHPDYQRVLVHALEHPLVLTPPAGATEHH